MPLCSSGVHATLQVALEQGTISLSVATELFKAARLSKAESTKDATLANTPCTQTEDDYTFSVANYNDTVTDSARERYLGLTNRVIAGMLLHTTRTTPVNCTDSRFSDIESLCKGGRIQSVFFLMHTSNQTDHALIQLRANVSICANHT